MRSPEYDNENNEIIIGGSADDSDYEDYSRKLERRQRGGASRSSAKSPRIEYADGGAREQDRREKNTARTEPLEPESERPQRKPGQQKAPVIERIDGSAPRIKRIEREPRKPEPVEERPVVETKAPVLEKEQPEAPVKAADEIFDDVMSTAAQVEDTAAEAVEEIIPDVAESAVKTEVAEKEVDDINDFIDSTGDYFGDETEEEYDEQYVEQYVESFEDVSADETADEEYDSGEADNGEYDDGYEDEPEQDDEDDTYGSDYAEPAAPQGEEIDYYYVDEDEGFDENGLPIPVVKPRDVEAVRRAKAERKAEGEVRRNLLVSASPHIHCGETTRIIMGDVIVALIPALIASILWFGWRSLMLTGVCIVSCVLTEYISRRVMKRRQTIGDLSAVVTGMILAFCLPPEINPLFAVVGSVVAIAVVKQMFGGIGMNFANPAATARIVLMLSFPVAMTTWSRPFFYTLDAVTEATPLAKLAEGSTKLPTHMELLVGYHGGCLGETCAVALLLGGIYLLIRRVITWEIPVCFMGTVMLFSLIVGQDPIYQVLSGGVVLGAVFMATDYVTSPVNRKGKIVYGIGCGLLTMLIRLYGNMPEGVSFAILLMNILTPHIDNLTLSKPFGEEREAA